MLAFTLVFSTQLNAQKTKKFKYNALPVVFFSPETGLAFGGLINTNFYLQDSAHRPSSLLLGGAYTLKKQLLLYLPYEFNWGENKYTAKGELGYYRYFYNYYGIGPEASSDFELYTVNFPRFKANFAYRISGNNFIGLRYTFDNYRIQSLDPEGSLLNDQISGYQGSLVSTPGLFYSYDSRDNIFNASQGWFITSAIEYNGNVTGSQFTYSRLTIDIMKYYLIKNNVLALNLYGGLVNGDAPFQELILYGGPNKGRGYFQGRFRDTHLLMLQTEYRMKVWKRFGATIFGTLGNVSNSISSFKVLEPKYNFGLGLRYMINPADRLNIRVDYAWGKESTGLYITFAEAF